MKNIKKSYIVIGILLVIAIAGLLVMLLKDGGENPEEKTTAPPFEYDAEEFLERTKHEGDVKTPIMQTDIDDVFYTINTKGEVQFFEYDGNKLKETEATGSYDVRVNCSRQDIPATVYYYEKDEKITGFGLFTTEISDAQVLYYEYAFFRLMNMPENFNKSGAYLLLVDTNKDDFYKDEKIYQEIFEYNVSSNSTKKLLYDANRGLDLRGALREGYHMITTDVVKAAKDYMFFFSSRHHHLTGEKFDIFRSGEAGYNNKDNARRAIEVADYYCRTSDSGKDFYFLKSFDDGFSIMLNTKQDSEDDEEIKSFKGKYSEDYIRFGHYIIEKSSLKLINLESLDEKTINIESKEDFKVDMLCVDDLGNVFLRGIYKNVPTIVLADIDGDKAKIYHNDDFKFIINPIPLSDGSFLVSIAKDVEGSQYKYVIFA